MYNRWISILAFGLMVLPISIFCSFALNIPHLGVITFLIYLTAIITGPILKFRERNLIYTIVFLLILTVLGEVMTTIDRSRLGVVMMIFRGSFFLSLFIYSSAISLFFASRKLNFAFFSLSAGAAIFYCSDIHGATDRESLAGVFSFIYQNWNMALFGFICYILFSILLGLQLYFKLGGRTRYRTWMTLLAFVFLFTINIGVQIYLNQNPTIRYKLSTLLSQGAAVIFDIAGSRPIPRDDSIVDLRERNRGVNAEQDSEVVLSVSSAVAPGYLRGRSFAVYDKGIWSLASSVEQESKALNVRVSEGIKAESYFSIEEEARSENTIAMSIYSKQLPGKGMFYYPAGVKQISLIADGLYLSSGGNLVGEKVITAAGYRLDVDSKIEAWQYPKNAIDYEFFRNYPSRLEGVLDDTLFEAEVEDGMSDREIFAKLLKFFDEKFTYRLPQERLRGDPILHFLDRSREGHCELFASSMVLLLRLKSIPSRYVTGFICEEPGRYANTYLARSGNAHAWVEAFDRQRNCWVHLEPTPASSAIAERPFEGLHQDIEYLELQINKLIADFRRGLIGDFLADIFISIFKFLTMVWILPIWLGVLIYVYWRYIKKRLVKRGSEYSELRIYSEVKSYKQFCKKLRKRGIIKSSATFTAQELESYLSCSEQISKAELEVLLAWLKEYKRRRYFVD